MSTCNSNETNSVIALFDQLQRVHQDWIKAERRQRFLDHLRADGFDVRDIPEVDSPAYLVAVANHTTPKEMILDAFLK
jgi:hypothetical protein